MKKLEDLAFYEYYNDDDESWSLPGEESSDSLHDFLIDILGFCECGDNTRVLRYVMEGLIFCESWYTDSESTTKNPFSSSDEKLFFQYVMNENGLLEHGGSVMCSWKTQFGEQFVEAAQFVLEELEQQAEGA